MSDEATSALPRLLLLSGASGAGKSTVAVDAASELGIYRIVSSDMIREVLRSQSSPGSQPALFRSTFSIGESTDAVTDWIDTCAAVESGIEAVINRARREGCDIIIEGAHVIPANRLISEWREAGGVALGITLVIDNEDIHRERIKAREINTHRGSARYLASFKRIRQIQSGQITRAKGAGWKLLDTHLHSDIPKKITQWFNEEWYRPR